MAQVLICGSAVTDMVFDVPAFPDRPEKYTAPTARIVGGGCAANAAVAVARLGGHARLCARMGRDLVGDLTVAQLRGEGVDCAHVLQVDGGQSAFSSVLVTPDGERQIVAFRGAGLPIHPILDGPDPDAVLADTRWPEAAADALALARRLGIPGILDGEEPVRAEVARLASHVAFSAQGLRAFAGLTDLPDALARAARSLGTWVGVTDGARGTWYIDAAGGRHHVPAFAVVAVDTLGAGDVWHGALALRLAEGAPVAEAVRFASAVAALKCTRAGGRDGAPTRAETEAFLERTAP